ncbi:hypothetical protein C1Y40_05180 [Mycobacterium talmoniae]|uniref:Uncharacterized protein n=1 Tax=Mycobacterium talmoniae TaxID=1858794 RepID=A0A2S8BDA8_9MYCO|nr:hypothetical protein C1Y40_05180 [Mycobacterium talmoniae]
MVSEVAISRAMPPNSRRIQRHTSATPSGSGSARRSVTVRIIVKSPPALNPGSAPVTTTARTSVSAAEFRQRAPQLPYQRRGQRVEPVGFVERHHRAITAVLDPDPTGRPRVVTVGDHPRVKRFCHRSSSSLALARNAVHAASAKVLMAPRGIFGSDPAIQCRLNSCAGPNHNAAVIPGCIRRSAP